MRSRSRITLGATLGALTWIAGCAHSRGPELAAAAPPATPTAQPAVEQRPPVMPVTGSHLLQRVDPVTGLPATAYPVRIYQAQDLARTGRPQVAGPLERLDPALGP